MGDAFLGSSSPTLPRLSPTVGRFDDRWGEHHHATIARAVLDDGLNLREALRRAKARQLDGTEAFDMPRSTARGYVEKEKQRRQEHELTTATAEDASQAVHGLVRRALVLLGNELSKLERAREPDPLALERLLKAADSARKLSQALPREQWAGMREPKAREGATQSYTPAVEAMMEAARRQQLGQPDTSHAEPLTEEPEAAHDESQTAERDCLPHANGGDEASAEEHERRREIRAELEAAAEEAFAQTERARVSVVRGNQRPIGRARYPRSRIARPKGGPRGAA
jgi:hypothetical protein